MTDPDRAPVPLPTARKCPFDPPEDYRALRENDPVAPLKLVIGPNGDQGWLVTRLADAKKVLTDPRFSHRNELLGLPIPPPFPMDTYEPKPSEPGSFNKMDPPDHTRYRKLLARHFTVRRIAALTPAIERITAECLDAMEAGPRPVDLVEAFADPVPGRVMCELLGVPESSREELSRHMAVLSRMEFTLDELIVAITAIGEMLQVLVKEKIDAPGDDVLSELAKTGELEDAELSNLAWALIGGGFDTTMNMIALGTFALLEHPDQLALLRAKPELLDNAVEQLLRYLTISHLGASRAALEDVELEGRRIREGELVVVALAAANRDPAQFTEPDTLDITASAQGHLAFGHGVHQCIGQNLARSVLKIALRELLARFGDLALAVEPGEVRMRDDMLHYGVHELPVTWGA